ncbi:MAG: FAD-dependent oxidoreductase [Gemmatimonadetes bacterium]|nr:FAD-dependent oxidoreductase [Gemmatimonadota bacterium]
MSRSEVLRLFPGLETRGLTGAAIFADGQMYNPPRLVLAAVKSAESRGAVVANHVEAVGLIREGSRVTGVEVRDNIDGGTFAISGSVVLNAAGPYGEGLIRRTLGLRLQPPGNYSRDACFVVRGHLLHPSLTIAVQGQTGDPDAIVSRGNRHLFVAPWRQYSLVGTWHKVCSPEEELSVSEQELNRFVAEVNAGYPDLNLSVDDISMYNCGFVPFGENREGAKDLRYGHRSRLVDHSRDGLENLISLVGVRFTTGRREAERAVALAFHKLGKRPPPGKTSSTPMWGGDIENWSTFKASLESESTVRLHEDVWSALAHNYGTEAGQVLETIAADPALAHRIGDTDCIRAQVLYAVREEMATSLSDVVFRRTDLATGGHPGPEALEACAEMVSEELELDGAEQSRQMAEVERRFGP